MKRFIKVLSFVAVVIVIIAISAVGAFAADDCDHSYGDVTMRGAKVSDATCTESAQYKAICTKCGQPSETVTHPFGAPLGHDYGEWITTSGKHTRNCERDGCSYSESEGCSYSDTSMRGAKVSDATCTESAQYKAICTKCGQPSDTVTHPFGAPLGHDYGGWTITSGKHTRYCERDGCSYSESGFCSFGAWQTVTSASCTSKGEQKRVCSECGNIETKSIDVLGHNYVNNVCSVCGDDKTDETTKVPDETTKAPDETTKAPDETTKVPDETTKAPDKTTSVLVKDHPIEKMLGVGLSVALVLGVIVIVKKIKE